MRGWMRDLANDAYAAGRAAQESGARRETNPHGAHPDSAARWFAGFDAATKEARHSDIIETPPYTENER